jgi:hypothetical protein
MKAGTVLMLQAQAQAQTEAGASADDAGAKGGEPTRRKRKLPVATRKQIVLEEAAAEVAAALKRHKTTGASGNSLYTALRR